MTEGNQAQDQFIRALIIRGPVMEEQYVTYRNIMKHGPANHNQELLLPNHFTSNTEGDLF